MVNVMSGEGMQSADIPETIPDNVSVIVFSDFHLGLKEMQKIQKPFKEFCKFLDGVYAGGDNNPEVIVDGAPKKLRPPSKIILLGDFLDLWSPRCNNRAACLADCYPIMRALFAYPAQIVYVSGNHDDEVAGIEGWFPVRVPENDQASPVQQMPADPRQERIECAMNSGCRKEEDAKLVISERHWPPTPRDEEGKKIEGAFHPGIQIGSHRYFFMHGQQFDTLYIFVGLLQNYPGWVSKNYSLFRDHPLLKYFFWSLFALSFLYVAAGKTLAGISTAYDGAVYFLLGLSFVIYIFTLQPVTLRGFWESVSGRIYTKYATIATVIEDGYWQDGDGKKILADTVVFGHTHIADDSGTVYMQSGKAGTRLARLPGSAINKRFINSGSWGDEQPRTLDGLSYTEKNTFLYIDADGPVLFRWPDDGHLPTQITRTLTGGEQSSGLHPSMLRYWIRQNVQGRG
jgi:predicted phosphodiesterase